MKSITCLGAFFTAVIAGVNVALGAANASWTGSGSSSRWLDADNWSASDGATLPPSGNTDVYFNNVDNMVVLFDSATELNWKAQFHNGIETPIVFNASEPSYGLSLLHSSYGNFRVGNGSNNGYLKIASGIYSGAAAVYVADGASKGKLEVSGGVFEAKYNLCVGQGGSAEGELLVNGGTVSVTGGDLQVACNVNTTKGVVNVSSGRLIVANSFKHGAAKRDSLSEDVMADGTISGDAVVSVGNEFNIGHSEYNKANLTISGGTVSAKDLCLGRTSGAWGNLDLLGGSVTAKTLVAYATGTHGTMTIGTGAVLNTADDYFSIGSGNGSYGSVTNNGGTVVAKKLALADEGNKGLNARAEYVQKAGTTTIGSSGVRIGNNAGSVSNLRVEGGEMSVSGDLALSYGGSTTGIVEIVGGTLAVTGEATFGSNWDNGCGDLVVSGGTASFAKGINFKYSHAGDSGRIALKGGALEIPYVKVEATGGTYALALDGGTLRATSANPAFLPASTCFAASVTANGGTIDTAGNNVGVAAAISGSGTLTKAGSGVLTFADLSNFAGKMRIVGGSVVVPDGYTYPGGLVIGNGGMALYPASATGTIEVEEGGKLVLDMTDKGNGTYQLPSNVTLPTGANPADYYIINTGRTTTETFNGDGTVTIANAEGDVDTVWTGLGANNAWTNSLNWSRGVPTQFGTAVFLADAEVTGSAQQTGASTWTAGTDKLGTLRLADGITLKLCSPDTYRVSPLLAPTNIVGQATIILYCSGLTVQSDYPLTVPATVQIVTWTQNWNNHTKKFSYLKGVSGTQLTVDGTVTSPFGGVHSPDTLDTYEFQNPFKAEHAVFNSNIVIESVTVIRDAHYDYCTRFENCTINGNISGSGSIAFYNGTTLNGDNSAFSGYAMVMATGEVGVGNANAGSANARWSIRGGFSFVKDAIAENSVFRLGSVTNFNKGESSDKGGLAFKMDATQPKLTVEIGALGEDMDLCAYTNQGVRVRSSEAFVIKKVGAGTFKTSIYGCRNWIVAEGTLAFAQVPVAEGVALNLDSNSQAVKYIDQITVCSNAVLKGVVTPEAVGYVGEVVYEPGALIGLDYTGGDFVAGVLDATVNTYTVNGAVLSMSDEVLSALAACQPGASFTLLAANDAIQTGSYVQEIVVSRDSHNRPKLVWRSRGSGKSLAMHMKDIAAGFAIILR